MLSIRPFLPSSNASLRERSISYGSSSLGLTVVIRFVESGRDFVVIVTYLPTRVQTIRSLRGTPGVTNVLLSLQHNNMVFTAPKPKTMKGGQVVTKEVCLSLVLVLTNQRQNSLFSTAHTPPQPKDNTGNYSIAS